MSEVRLIPTTEFSTRGERQDLALDLGKLAVAHESYLRSRNLAGVLRRYGSAGAALSSVVQRSEQADPEHLVVIDATSGDVCGAASVFRQLPLYKLRTPMPAAFPRHVGHALGVHMPLLARSVDWVLRTSYPYARPNMHAWVAPNADEEKTTTMHTEAYRMLLQRAEDGSLQEPRYAAWTIEPTSSPKYVHKAITDAGLTKIATRRFDDGETGNVPPRATLYAGIQGSWWTSIGRQAELRTGFWQPVLPPEWGYGRYPGH